jgi:hypothetical protein
MLTQVEEEKRQERVYILEKARLLKVSSSQFTCFTSTKVRIFTARNDKARLIKVSSSQFTCFTSTKVRILTARNDKARLLEVSKFSHDYMCPHYYQEEKAAAL